MLGRGKAYVWFLAGLAAIAAGFWPTFYGDPGSNDVWHTLHGVAATLWVLLLIAQSMLVGRRSYAVHERLGWLSAGLFGVLLATSGYMVWIETVGREPFPAALRQELVFLDVAFLLLFIVVYVLGLVFRRKPQLHARLMGSTILIGLGPALGRLYAEHIHHLHGLSGGLPWALFTIDTILIVAIGLELRHRRTTWPFPTVLAAFLLIGIGMSWAKGGSFGTVLRAAGAPI